MITQYSLWSKTDRNHASREQLLVVAFVHTAYWVNRQPLFSAGRSRMLALGGPSSVAHSPCKGGAASARFG
jgi:hypothetical protein